MDAELDFPVVQLPRAAVTPQTACEYLIGWLVSQRQIRAVDAETVKREIANRESLGSTAVGRAVAIPHAFCGIQNIAGVIGRSAHGIDWSGAPDRTPVTLVCLVVAPIAQQQRWVGTLEKLAGQLEHLR
jgi:mannitol/fructose-specific phosphotransferase system IIA component (Ntr-type)